MSTGTENAPALRGPELSAAPPGRRGVGDRSVALLRRYVWWIVGVVIVAIATAAVLHARTSPGFDPYGWLVWGYQTLRLNLDLGGAPSWKPVTFLFTVPYSVTGHLAYWLWMITAASFALAGPVIAGRLVFRLVRESTGEVWPAAVGAVFSGVAILGIYQYTHYWLSSQSDPMLLTFFLWAIDMHLTRHPRWALTFLFLCSIGRPETWPFMGLYSIWAWLKFPRMRWMIVAEIVLIPAFWFGVPVLSGNYWDIAGKIAEHSPRELHSNKILGTITRFRQLTYWPVELLAGLGLVWAAWRRNLTVLAVAGCSALWMAIEVGFSLHGFPGVPRYMFEAAGAEIVVAGIALGWLLSEPRRLAPRRFSAPAGLAGLAVAVALVALIVPDLSFQVSLERKDLTHERARTREIHRLDAAIKAVGGYRFVRGCGDPTTDVEYVSILAWYTKMNVGQVGHRPKFQITKQNLPLVLFTALPNGWVLHTYHLSAAAQRRCAGLDHTYWIVDGRHPGGVLIHKA